MIRFSTYLQTHPAVKDLLGDLAPVGSALIAWIINGGMWGVLFGLLAFVLGIIRALHAWELKEKDRLANKKTEIELETLRGINSEMAADLEKKLVEMMNKLKENEG